MSKAVIPLEAANISLQIKVFHVLPNPYRKNNFDFLSLTLSIIVSYILLYSFIMDSWLTSIEYVLESKLLYYSLAPHICSLSEISDISSSGIVG